MLAGGRVRVASAGAGRLQPAPSATATARRRLPHRDAAARGQRAPSSASVGHRASIRASCSCFRSHRRTPGSGSASRVRTARVVQTTAAAPAAGGAVRPECRPWPVSGRGSLVVL